MYNTIDINELKGNFLLATPVIADERFKKTIIFICDSKPANSFGFTIKKDAVKKNETKKDEMKKDEIAAIKKQLKNTQFEEDAVYSGGPVSTNHLFILHSNECLWPQTLHITDDICVTNFEDAIKIKKKPEKYMLLAGYTNWTANQLEREIILGFWVVAKSDSESGSEKSDIEKSGFNTGFDIIFGNSKQDKWQYLMRKMDVNENAFSMQVGVS